MNTIFFVFLSALVLGVNCVVIKLKDGQINGTTSKTKTGRLFHEFLGIPYAKPPINELRFQPPVPAEPWNGIKDVTQAPPVCIQWTFLHQVPNLGQEDCLYINVIVPDEVLKSGRKVPVVVFIHGGGFQEGYGTVYAGDFMEKDVIFVSMNYRLGVLGFLAVNGQNLTTDNDQISGNFGLKDQSLALKWVKENIGQFNGDSANVTLMGGSAGAASIHFHMFSPLSKGLFQKAIMESGSAFSPWSRFPTKKYNETRIDQLVARIFLDETNCYGVHDVLTCLQKIPSEDFTTPRGGLQKMIPFLPVIEQNVSSSNKFFPEEPHVSNYVTKVPWLTGINSGEGAAIVPTLLEDGSLGVKLLNSRKEHLFPVANLYIQANVWDMALQITPAVDKFYFKTEGVSRETALETVKMITDSSWLYPLVTTVKSGPNQQYVYLFDYKADAARNSTELGVAHGEEGPVLIPDKDQENNRSFRDRRVGAAMMKYWANFIISGDPNRHSRVKLWQPVKTKDGSFEYLHIKGDGEVMEKNLFSDRYNLWKSLPTNYYQ